MKFIEKKDFVGETVELDGNGFLDCSFKNCKFVFRGKEEFGFRNPKLDNVTMEFVDNAALTVGALNTLYKSGGSFRQWVDHELKSIDGSFGTTKH